MKAAALDRDPDKLSIDFVGLFDTVEAYGVPIEEMREVVHRFVFPIKFGGDHTIWKKVDRDTTGSVVSTMSASLSIRSACL